MIISDLSSRQVGEKTEVSALIDNYRLWYRFPSDYAHSTTLDPFLAAAFFSAMCSGETVSVEPTFSISPQLHEGLRELQQIFGCWNKSFRPFDLNSQFARAEPVNQKSCAFFSGGVDGLYTLHTHSDEITDLIYINGFDFEMAADEFDGVLRRVNGLAELYGKNVIPVETNYYEFNRRTGIGRIWSHGSCLASAALLLGFTKCYIPSSHTYNELKPWGSHPLTDRLWSNEATKIVHDAAEWGRAEKIRAIAQKPGVLDRLVVCWNLPDANCGECEKCIRTMITLSILNLKSRMFPRQITPAEVRRLKPSADERYHLLDNWALAKDEGVSEMQDALAYAVRESEYKKLARSADRAIFGGALASAYRRLRGRAGTKRQLGV